MVKDTQRKFKRELAKKLKQLDVDCNEIRDRTLNGGNVVTKDVALIQLAQGLKIDIISKRIDALVKQIEYERDNLHKDICSLNNRLWGIVMGVLLTIIGGLIAYIL